MKKIAFIILGVILTITGFSQNEQSNDSSDYLFDKRDGKRYKTVHIKGQIWMAENLAFKRDSGCWAFNDDQRNITIYGYLYN